MAVRGDEVASSIEAHVREAIERMVGEIRSSVEDVRTTVDSQLKAALQSVQADVNSISFLPHIQKSIGELEETLKAAAPPAAPAPPKAAADSARVKKAVQEVEKARTQIDVLNALLEECLEFGSRAALLILRGETFSGWKGVGFTAHGGNDEAVKRFNAAPGLLPELDRVLRNEQVVTWDGANLSTRLGVSGATRGVLIPMVIKDKVAAAVFVDAIGEDAAKMDVSALELLVFITGLLIDTLSIRKKSPAPSLNDSAAATAAAPAPPPEQPVPTTTQGGSSTVAISAAQMREMMSSSSPGAFATTAMPAIQPPLVRPTPPPPPPPAPPPATPPSADESRPSTQYVPPAGVRSGAALGGPQTEEGKKHDEARRFARLLVSEIKLYNESKVEQGRKNKDLYERLKEDIDRSRQMYDERIADDVRKSSNYFYDELVRILADGDSLALGL